MQVLVDVRTAAQRLRDAGNDSVHNVLVLRSRMLDGFQWAVGRWDWSVRTSSVCYIKWSSAQLACRGNI